MIAQNPARHEIVAYALHRLMMPSGTTILIAAAMIAAAILLSTLISAVGTRYDALQGPTEDTAWLVDRLTGKVYRCQAADRGPADCQAEMTGSINSQKR